MPHLHRGVLFLVEVEVSCHKLPPILALAVPTGCWHREALAFCAHTTCMLTVGQLGGGQGEEKSLPAVRRSWVTSCSGTSLSAQGPQAELYPCLLMAAHLCTSRGF